MFSFLLLAVISEAKFQIGLLTSPFTSQTLKNQLASNLEAVLLQVETGLNLPEPIEIVWAEVDLLSETDESKWQIPSPFLDKGVIVFLDAAFSIRYSSFLADQALKNSYLHVVISRPINTLEDETTYPNTLYAETSFISQAEAILDLINHYSWSNIGIIQDKQINNAQMSSIFKSLVQSPIEVKDQIILDIDDTLEADSISYRLQSTTRDSGARVIVVMSLPSIAAQVLRAADQSVMGGVGFSWILNSDAMKHIGETLRDSNAGISTESYGVLKTGAIGLMATDAIHEMEEPLNTYLSVITLACQGFLSIENPSGTDLFKYILSNPESLTLDYELHFTKDGLKKSTYDLYNIVNFSEIKVGSWNPDTHMFQLSENFNIIWPGFTTDIPNDVIPIIQLGLLYPAHDNEGNELLIGEEIKNGFSLAIEEINADPSLLNGYQIQSIYTDTFLFPSLASANLRSLSSYNILGFVGPHSLELCDAYAAAENSYIDVKPMITYSASSTSLSSSNVYGSLLQIVQPDGLQAVALTLFIQLQGWKKIGVIYTNDEYGIGVYESFLANVGTLEVTISNLETKRVIDFSLDSSGNLSSTTKQSVIDVLGEIVRNQIKVIVYLGNPKVGPELAKVGYEKELHGSEYAWIGTMWLTDDVLVDIENNYKDHKDKIYGVINGAFGLDYRKAQGEKGLSFEASYKAKFDRDYSTLSMLTYDSVYTFASVISGMISRGDDYNSGKELTNSLRSADLTGASGKIKFSEGSNGRSAYGYNIINFQKDTLVNVLEYDPLNPNLFTSINNATILWGGGASSPPEDSWPYTYDCPFAQHMSSTSSKGLGIIISIGTFLFLTTLGLSFFSYRKWKQLDISQITSTVTRSWKDTLVQAQIAVEFFQFVAIAPTFSSLQIVIQAASNIFMLDVMKVASTSKGDYWILLATVCGLCYIWFLLVLLIMLNGEHWLKHVPFCKRMISILNSVFLPFYGNTFFLPALALLLDMFVCDHKAQGHDYVWRDCYTKCWEGKHNTYIVMSTIAIVCYEPIAAYSRPLWQQSRTGLNLKIQPFFLLLKTCMQILLIAIGKSLQSTSPLAHGIVFTILISTFTGLIYKLKPFNYHRCNLWEFSSILAVAYMSFLATLSYAGDPTNVGWFIALAIGWATIIGVSLFIQRKYMPNLLIPPGGSRSKKKIYDIISIKENKDLDESNIEKNSDYKAVDQSSMQAPNNEQEKIDVSIHDNENEAEEEDDEAKPI
ncbi:hypothetical protein SteCoe_21897 [Stentor coeruleus]|uniref:Receptor ligand binding region domain-containing protein n=1 Tax=Stentor coeruleus TaxID=5963 RepID=A0A1R2BNG3_9CILI|nr:hypothetical protein SteCoe_21897 [Stentor coeruleus]